MWSIQLQEVSGRIKVERELVMKTSKVFTYKLQNRILCRVAFWLVDLYNRLIMTVTPVAVYMCAIIVILLIPTKILLLAHASTNLDSQTAQVHAQVPIEFENVPTKPERYSLESRTCHSQPLVSPELKEAYVTLLFGDFLLGVRVLGQSLKETGTTREMVVLTSSDVSLHTKDILLDDGWIVKPLQDLPNPHSGEKDKPNFLTKLLTWQMTEYRRVVYIDADVVVTMNVDELFRCGSFCITYRHSDLFNCGVEVLKPSAQMFKKFYEYIPYINPKYQDDDQVLLNEYYHDLKYATLFNTSDTSYCENAMRLPAGYNGDVGMYYLNSRWKMPLDDIKMIHYTMGPVKPWKWWGFTLFDLNWKWHELRSKLNGETEPGFFTPRNWIPLFVVGFVFLIRKFASSRFNQLMNKLSVLKLVWNTLSIYRTTSKFLPLTFLAISTYFTFKVVPETMTPYQACASFCLWCTFFHILLYGMYCYTVYQTGLKHSTSLGLRKMNSFLSPKIESMLWAIVSIILILQFYYLPFFVSPFSYRIQVFLVGLVYVVMCHHFIGLRVMYVWYGHERTPLQTLL